MIAILRCQSKTCEDGVASTMNTPKSILMLNIFRVEITLRSNFKKWNVGYPLLFLVMEGDVIKDAPLCIEGERV